MTWLLSWSTALIVVKLKKWSIIKDSLIVRLSWDGRLSKDDDDDNNNDYNDNDDDCDVDDDGDDDDL